MVIDIRPAATLRHENLHQTVPRQPTLAAMTLDGRVFTCRHEAESNGPKLT
jgi:hypothetical protein